jgi:enterochelin esterase-like enzyme
MATSLSPYLDIHRLKHFGVQTLHVKSSALEGNPLGDPCLRTHPVLVPRTSPPKEGFPVVFVLSGFTGNGTQAFNVKTFEPNQPELLDQARDRGEAPAAIFVFVDAMTFWGGSQFINSTGTGRYEDFVAKETVDAVLEHLPSAKTADRWCVTGGSSGGYGALHLASRFPERFGYCAAIAPDSFFEASLLTGMMTGLAMIAKIGGVEAVKRELQEGKLTRRKDYHVVLDTIAMGLCYAPDGRGGVDWPIDPQTGVVIPDKFARVKEWDPVVFLEKRTEQVRKLKGVFLDVGMRDQFFLQYGSRQIKQLFERSKIPLTYSEFDGTHFEIGERRPFVWKWLAQNWIKP